jgi:hypothetical protein
MPLEEFSSETAIHNLRSRSAIWPSRGKNNRKGLLPLPEIKPRFQFKDDDHIFCLGSCFAQHVGSVLSGYGFNVATDCQNPYMQGAWGGSNHLIRYNIFAMLNEFRWALDPACSFNDDYFTEDENGLFMDPYGHTQEHPHPREKLKKLREFTFSVTRKLANCRIVIITLGLVEVWFDKTTGLYANMQPGKAAIRMEPDRFVLRVLNYQDVMDGLEKMHALLTKHGHPDFKMLLTTSPVPLHATFRGQDVFVANTYSKSVQRAVAGEFVSRHSNVDYFPSYESVTLGSPDLVWKDDQRHVVDQAVSAIMEHVLRSYAPGKNAVQKNIESIHKLDEQLGKLSGQLTLNNIFSLFDQVNTTRAELERLRAENTQLKFAANTDNLKI